MTLKILCVDSCKRENQVFKSLLVQKEDSTVIYLITIKEENTLVIVINNHKKEPMLQLEIGENILKKKRLHNVMM